MRRLCGFPQLGVKPPRPFLGAMSRFDPLRGNEIDTLLDQHKALQNQRKRPFAEVGGVKKCSCGDAFFRILAAADTRAPASGRLGQFEKNAGSLPPGRGGSGVKGPADTETEPVVPNAGRGLEATGRAEMIWVEAPGAAATHTQFTIFDCRWRAIR